MGSYIRQVEVVVVTVADKKAGRMTRSRNHVSVVMDDPRPDQ